MNPQAIIRKVLVAITMAAAAFATWAVTDFHEPAIEAAASAPHNG